MPALAERDRLLDAAEALDAYPLPADPEAGQILADTLRAGPHASRPLADALRETLDWQCNAPDRFYNDVALALLGRDMAAFNRASAHWQAVGARYLVEKT